MIYIATATVEDDDMRQRIAVHQARRPDHWVVIEEPLQLARVLEIHATTGHCFLIDCLTLWLTNLLVAKDVLLFERERADLLRVFPTLAGSIILVSNETNMGITPMGALSRRYCDEAGRLHQDLARICDRVILTVAGLPQVLKGKSLGQT